MTRAQILRKKTGIVLAIMGIVFSLLPALRLVDGTTLYTFQIIGNERFFDAEIIENSPEVFLAGILLSIVFIYGFLVHILNLTLWLRKTEKTYIGVMGFSWGSCLALLGVSALVSFQASGSVVAIFPLTIWQSLRILITFFEAIIKLHGEELFNVFFAEK